MNLEPARIAIGQDVLDRIARRVADAEIGYAPDDDADWRYGVDAGWLRGLRDHWRDVYDWRAAEAAFNQHAQFRCEIDGIPIHLFQFRATGGPGYPIVLTHGWPGSPLEFMAAAPLLAEQGFDVVVPSLPGYGFSGRPPRPISPAQVAGMWRRLMVDGLGYSRFGAQGGDWGSVVTRELGRAHGDVVGAIHLNMLHTAPPANPSPEFDAWQQGVRTLMMREGAYSLQHATKPQTIGLALADSPLGFAGWVIEKCRAWSDCGGDVERVFSKDALITNVMTYLVSGNVQSGIWMYRGLGGEPFAPAPIRLPTGFAEFPAEFLPPPPRAAVEESVNLVRWAKMPKGGHFAAWEQPEAFAREVGAFFRDYQ
ncbi:alpha/beta fold hydrolase [Phenylobacterium sp. LjRoot219]|uniref:epoxide hydrolase family protein n=1 Tax=Phenylobacterium sp. LjRoot219 TaxID=3342283 RepID=UPI003ECC3523